MPQTTAYDAVVVGAGPNGLAAAITLAAAGQAVLLVEANDTIGGSVRSAALTQPGFVHDLGSAIHPLCLGSPFFRSMPLERYGLEWIQPDLPVAHPLDDGTAAFQHRSLAETAATLGPDGPAYQRLMQPFVDHWEVLLGETLQPLLHIPRHPLLLARFGLQAIRSAKGVAEAWFETERARALFAGIAAHATLPLEQMGSSAFGLVLGLLGHAVGWPMPKGGAQRITDALAAHFRALGGTIETGRRITSLDDLPPAHAVLLDVTPRQLLHIAEDKLPLRYRRRLEDFRYGWSVFKVDYALHASVPWQADAAHRAGTLHLGGTLDEIAAAEREVAAGRHPERPYVLVAQHSLFDDTRAPADQHTLWAYCHTPQGSTFDMTDRIEQQIERFAPGFRDCILQRHVTTPAGLERSNANLVEGTINGGAMDLMQLLARPVFGPVPYRTPLAGVYLCSSSTPPGGGVHGMCGLLAAKTALRDLSSKVE
ncbi:MAG TPA: NAD(P)/FAD-dependent oxidoreductase [Rhodothermales bacterium]|nr:NAD(P)/FAD-dependent oxidoreductase [Rhodothermales bacterium]